MQIKVFEGAAATIMTALQVGTTLSIIHAAAAETALFATALDFR